MSDLSKSFLSDIVANIDDDTPRLVFADWLDENGQPERADLIRVQIESARLPHWDAAQVRLRVREQALLKAHAARWIADLPKIKGVAWRGFRRGFVAEAEFTSFAVLEANRAACWDAAPIEAVTIRWPKKTDKTDELRLPSLRELSLSARMVNVGDAERLAASPILSTLRVLDITGQGMSVEGYRHLLSSPRLRRVEALRVGHNQLGDAGVEALADSALSPSELDLSEGGDYGAYGEDPLITWMGIGTLAAWDGLERVRKLSLSGNIVGQDGLRALVASPLAAGLKELVLRSARLDTEGPQGFFAATPGLKLDAIDLSMNMLEDGALGDLGKAVCLRELKALRLDMIEMDDDEAKRLARAKFLATLRTLRAEENLIEVEGFQALLKKNPPHLHSLRLRSNNVWSDGAAHLAAWKKSDALLYLDLSQNEVGDEGFKALAETKHLPNLQVLHLANNPAKKRAANALVASPLGKRLLHLGFDPMPDPHIPY